MSESFIFLIKFLKSLLGLSVTLETVQCNLDLVTIYDLVTTIFLQIVSVETIQGQQLFAEMRYMMLVRDTITLVSYQVIVQQFHNSLLSNLSV